MSYTNQTTTSLADFISKLNTFLSGTPAWTTNHTPANGEWAARKTPGAQDVAIATQWDTGTPSSLGIYQWRGAAYNGGASPWNQNEDSGNGAASTSDALLAAQRSALITNMPLQFWCFENDDYFHVVVETSTLRHAHFGAGVLDKFNDYAGGEYVFGHHQDPASSNSTLSVGTTFLLDGICVDGIYASMELFAATIRLSGLPDQAGASKYGVCMGQQADKGTDRAANARVLVTGGYRAGAMATPFALFRGTRQRGLNPMHPIVPFYWNDVTSDIHGPLGQLPDVRGVNIRDFAPGEEVTIGGDTWVMFPASRKATSDTESSTNYSKYQGIAYKKVTT